MIHSCPDCGLVHDHVQPPAEDPQVAIARIQAESAAEIARITAHSDRDWNETREAVAAIEADATVEAAAIEAEVIGDAIESAGVSEPDPVIIDVPGQPGPEPDDDPEALPPAEGSPAPEPAARKSLGLGMW